jgi:hypothetical protein
MPKTRQFVERKLAVSRKQLAILEEKIAMYTELEAPVHLITQRDMEQEEIARLEALLESGELIELEPKEVSLAHPLAKALPGDEEIQMSKKEEQDWWNDIPASIGGDVIIGHVGAGATGVAIGKNITQTVYDVLGEPTPDDKQVIEQKLSEAATAVQELREQLDAATATMAEFQLRLLQGELTKTEEGETPSASTITQVGDWLLDNVPQIAEILTSLFATPAVGRVVGKAGEVAVEWVKKRFGRS